MRTMLIGAALAAAALLVPLAAEAQDHSRLYTRAEIAADAKRLETAFRKGYEVAAEPFLTPAEKAALGNLVFRFPRPEAGDYVLDFYTYSEGGENVVAAPVLSLKALEDLTTAFAWLHTNKYSLDTIDLYFAMLRRRDPAGFPGGRYPKILPTLGVPEDAYKHSPVDQRSLWLRNEAFIFILLHELAHIILNHKPYSEITVAQARADEVAADQFALDVMSRSGITMGGAMIFFQAQVYSLPNRGQFASDAAFVDFLAKRSTHPLTSDRLLAMAEYSEGPLARRRPKERATWVLSGRLLRDMVALIEDRETQDCMAIISEKGRVDVLGAQRAQNGRRQASLSLFKEFCQ